jgi:hypothetical protein
MPPTTHPVSGPLPGDLVDQLLALVERLREETADCFEHPGEQQPWYDRGYANGIVQALQTLGEPRARGLAPDDPVLVEGSLGLPWGKAYRHGEEVGHRETYEIAGIPLT